MTDQSVSNFTDIEMTRGAIKRAGQATAVGRKSTAARGSRAARQAERREAILAAALDEFAASGFAATRLDDVAKRAGVAKGTIYLYFRDKESLFQELVRAMLSPMVGALERAPLADLPARAVAETIAELFAREIFGTRRKDVIRLILTEGARFPQLLVAPALVAIVWNGLFDRFSPLDVRELMRAHIDLLFGEGNAT
jgi:AcrR family transcriptional regulator